MLKSKLLAAAMAVAVSAPFAALAQTSEPTQPASPPAQAGPQAQAEYTDEQLRAFGAAAVEIDPIGRELANASETERQERVAQIREILERHELDADTYNAIAQRAQNDPTLRARIASLQESAQPPG